MKKHFDEEVEIYCKTCKISICSECVRKEHSQHEFITVSKLYRKLNNNRSVIAEEIRKTANRKLLENKRTIRDTKYRNKTLHNMKVTRLKEKRAEIHKLVDSVIDCRLQVCESNLEQNNAEVKQFDDKHLAEQSRIDTMIVTFQNTTMVGLDLIEYHEALQTAVSEIASIDLTEYEDRQINQEGEVD